MLKTESKSAAALVYGPDPGYMPLRVHIAKWLDSFYSPPEGVTADRLCITHGASGSLQNILSKFTDPVTTKAIWMVEPSYFLACPIFMDAGFQGKMRGVPEDCEGIDIEYLRSALQACNGELNSSAKANDFKRSPVYPKVYKHVIYAVPTFANPSGKVMSLRRRHELVRLAREFDALVVTDDVYDMLRWPEQKCIDACPASRPPPRVVDIDRHLDGGPQNEWGNAISNGSFSKIIAPGVRTGWVEASPAFVIALSKVGATCSGGCGSQLAAAFVAEMLETGSLQAHIQDTLIPTYRARCYALLEAVEKHLIPLGFRFTGNKAMLSSNGEAGAPSSPEPSVVYMGGYFVYLRIPEDLPVNAKALAALALENRNLKVAYGDMMGVVGDSGSFERARNGFGACLRLCWSWHTETEIVEGITRLASLVFGLREGVSKASD